MMVQQCIKSKSIQELEISICDTCVHEGQRTINNLVKEEVLIQWELINDNKKENDCYVNKVGQRVIVQ